jgi:hypothetical protein
MKKLLLSLVLCFGTVVWGTAQVEITDFESFNLERDTFLNGSDFSGGFDGNGIFLPNSYEDTYGSWSGWSISTVTDTVTPGFFNQYASIAGEGADGSTHYATSFVAGESIITITNERSPDNISVNNSTYAFLSMLNGDSFAKKFGGESGNDPDFFLLTIKGSRSGQPLPDSIDFYLADYRFDDNSLDYIINEWTTIDLTSLATADNLTFSLSSSDNGAFGMNTPAYFCIDNIVLSEIILSQNDIHQASTSIYPNPTADRIHIKSSTLVGGSVSIYNNLGQLMSYQNDYHMDSAIDISYLHTGQYIIEFIDQDDNRWVDTFIKK